MTNANKKEQFLAASLLEAVEDENYRNFKILVDKYEANASKIINGKGISTLHYAAGMENVQFGEQIIEYLLKFKDRLDLNVETNDGETPLHIASFWGRTKIVKLLLSNGVNITIQDHDERTAIDCALLEGHFNVIKLFQDHIFEEKLLKTKDTLLSVNLAGQQGKLNVTTNVFTPNRINYNFDKTSPFFVNITHRRKELHLPNAVVSNLLRNSQSPSVCGERNPKVEKDLTEKFNLFSLTEKNVLDFSHTNQKQSLAAQWRFKTNKTSTRRSINFFYDESHQQLDSFFECQTFGNDEKSLLTDELTNESPNETINDQTFLTAINESNFIKSPKHNGQFLCQMAEEYKYVDRENQIELFERKLSTELIERNDSWNGEDDDDDKDEENNCDTSVISSEMTIPIDYDTDLLRNELTQFGVPPGPIGKTTKHLYMKRLLKLKRNPDLIDYLSEKSKNIVYSFELEKVLRGDDWYQLLLQYNSLEIQMVEDFKQLLLKNRKLREGNLKTSFIYILIDPRITENLPGESKHLSKLATWNAFLRSIFYIGKGKNSRPYSHLYDAVKLFKQQYFATQYADTIANAISTTENTIQTTKPSPVPDTLQQLITINNKTPKNMLVTKQINDTAKLRRIIDIWKADKGVVCLHVFQNILPTEAFTREASIIDAIGIDNLSNLKRGDYYGIVGTWTMRCRKQLGCSLLYKALKILLANGESQLRPNHIM